MRGVVFLGDRELTLRDFPDPTPGPGEVVIAMKASGMCGSDLHLYRAAREGGTAASLGLGGSGEPVIGGHEPCGVVAARGAVCRIGLTECLESPILAVPRRRPATPREWGNWGEADTPLPANSQRGLVTEGPIWQYKD